MSLIRNAVDPDCFNPAPSLPYQLRIIDFESAMQDVYDFFHDVNLNLHEKGLRRFEDMLRPAMCSGLISDMLTSSLAKHSRTLCENRFFNGHPDLIVQGIYSNDSARSGEKGIEVKSTVKRGGAVDTHGARTQWLCVFVYEIDSETEPAWNRSPMKFTEVYLGHVEEEDFRQNGRGRLGTRTATLDRDGLAKLRQNWVYLDRNPS
ncbi:MULTISPECIES: hypothetical protein [unclassified Streptomyces]|uniref:hypothetical protein n=1 Tax=unclassified Streptomyces TaxID=2593676 RepID=UPI0033BE22A2